MSHPDNKIDNLTKVTLSLQAGTAPAADDLTPEPVTFEFIYGIGSQGLTPFEFELANRSEGETVVIPVRQTEASGFFGFIRPPVLSRTSGHEAFYLRARIVKVARAEGREVVRAMADMTACGECGGDCCGHDH